jgi:hypothetical protein
VALLAAGACQHPDKLPVDRQVAGTVVELDGTITATSVAGTRTLHANDAIGEDETIDTHEGRVVIVLTHNHARWELGPNHHGRVSESAAWKLALQDQPSIPVAQQSTPAGREAEPRAVDTAASTTEHRPAMTDQKTPPSETRRKQDPVAVHGGSSVAKDRPDNQPLDPGLIARDEDNDAPTKTAEKQDAGKANLKNSRRGDPASSARRIIAANAGILGCATAAMHLTVACTAAKCTLSGSVPEPARACLVSALAKLAMPAGDYTAVIDLLP